MRWMMVFGLLGLVAVAVGFGLRYWMGKAMFVPGSVEERLAALGESLDPPGAQDREGPRWAVAPGVELTHFAVGAGKNVVVVHGGPGLPPGMPWSAAQSGDGIRWHFYHQRGAGSSSRPIVEPPQGGTWRAIQQVEGRLGMAQQLADLERIRRILGAGKLTLVGHSFGGLIAALYAAEWPERVDRVVLVSPASLLEMPIPEDQNLFALVGKRLEGPARAEFEAYLKRYFDFPALLALGDDQLSSFYSEFSRYFALTGGLPQAPSSEPRPRPAGYGIAALYLSLGRHHDWNSVLQRVTAPTLVLAGRDDMLGLAGSRRYAEGIRGARLEIVERAGHFPFEENPKEFRAAVDRFLLGETR